MEEYTMKKIIAVLLLASTLLVACEEKTKVKESSIIADRVPVSSIDESSVNQEDYEAAKEVLDKFYNAMMIEKNAADVIKYSNLNMLHLVSGTEPVSEEKLLKTMEANLGNAASTLGVEVKSYEILDAEYISEARLNAAKSFVNQKDKEKRFSITKSLKFNAVVTTAKGDEPQEMYVSCINGEWKTDMALVPYVNIASENEENTTGESAE
jgi:hypothetical protein